MSKSVDHVIKIGENVKNQPKKFGVGVKKCSKKIFDLFFEFPGQNYPQVPKKAKTKLGLKSGVGVTRVVGAPFRPKIR